MLKELLKKKKTDMDPSYKRAKMGVLKEIHDMANNDMGDELRGMKKVTVASPDSEGLKMGLDKAQDMMSGHGMPDMGDDSSDEASDSDMGKPAAEEILEQEIDHESAEGDLSDDEIDELIALLQSKKAHKA